MELRRYAWISLAVAIFMIVAKTLAYRLTGSVSLLSDAIESIVNALGATAAIWALSLSARPPDDIHAHGHDKAEYFSSGFEGALIVVAAIGIIYNAIDYLITPQPITAAAVGIAINLVTTVINYVLAKWLMVAAKKHDSIALEADSHHLMSDVVSSIMVSIGVVVASMTPLWWVDPLLALVVGVNIIRNGWDLVRRSMNGLLDASFHAEDIVKLDHILSQFAGDDITFHAVRTRISGSRKFVSMHVLVPGMWSVQQGHEVLERIEIAILQGIPNSSVITHLEPNDDPRSFEDQALHRHLHE
ncbi:MAG: cation diffusion facilitator family transporter [Roseiflexaceae bacterium]